MSNSISSISQAVPQSIDPSSDPSGKLISPFEERRVELLEQEKLQGESSELKVIDSVSPIFKPTNDEISYLLSEKIGQFPSHKEVSTGAALFLPEMAEEEVGAEEIRTPTFSACSSSSAFSTPSVFSLYESPTSAFQSPESALQSPETSEVQLPPLSEGRSYILAYAALVQSSYTVEGFSEFPKETEDQLSERFEKIEKKLSSSSEQLGQNRAIFAYVQEMIQKNRRQVQASHRRRTEKGIIVLKPILPLKVTSLLERISSTLPDFKSDRNLSLLYPASALKKYLHVCKYFGVEYFKGNFIEDNLFIYFYSSSLSLNQVNLFIQKINEIEAAGQVPSHTGEVCTDESFPRRYSDILLIRDICYAIQKSKDDEIDFDEFDFELEEIYPEADIDDEDDNVESTFIPGDFYLKTVADLADSVVDKLLVETVHELNAIQLQKEMRAEKLKKAGIASQVAESILKDLFRTPA